MADRINAFLTMLERGQDSALLRFSLGNEYDSQGDAPSAALHLRKALQWDPNYSAAWKKLGRVLADSGQTAEAISVYEKGIAVAGKSGDRQAAKEMTVFLRRLTKNGAAPV